MMIFLLIWLDEDLGKLRSRDKSSLSRLYEENKDKVLNFLIIKLKGDKDTAEEVLCDTFHSIIESITKLKNLNNIQGWIIRIANNKLNDHFRKEYRHKKNTKDCIDSEEIASGQSIHDDLEKKQEVLMLDMAINGVKGEYQTILKLKYMEKRSNAEIAGALKKTVSAVNNLILRSKKALKTEFCRLLKEGFNEI